MLGFVESFQANFACRFCKMDTLQRSLSSLEDVVYLRTKSSYKNDLLLHDKSRTGIVFEFDMVALINYYIHETEFFSLEELNSCMMCHDSGLTDYGNIPPLIPEKDLKRDTI